MGIRNPDDWTHISVPTLVLVNEDDPLHPFHYGEVLAHAIPGATLKQITSKASDPELHARDVQHAIEPFLRSLE